MNRSDLMYYGLLGAVGAVGTVWAVRVLREQQRRRLPYAPLPVLRSPKSNVVVLAPEYGAIRVGHVDRFRRALESAEPPVSLVLHTLGGSIVAVDHIAHMVRMYDGPITAHVPYMALSGGTMIALAADEIVMEPTAILGPVDPQINGFPAVALMELVKRKSIDEIEDPWLLLESESRKALAETRAFVRRMTDSPAALDRLTSGETTHARAISYDEARAIGLRVRPSVPPEVTLALDDELARAAGMPPPFPMPCFQADARTGFSVTRLANLEPALVGHDDRKRGW